MQCQFKNSQNCCQVCKKRGERKLKNNQQYRQGRKREERGERKFKNNQQYSQGQKREEI